MAKRIVSWLLNPRYRLPKVLFILGLSAITIIAVVSGISLVTDLTDPRSAAFLSWGIGNLATRESLVLTGKEPCPGAPFILPADGFIGLLYADPRGPYSSNNPHQGLDIFSPDRDLGEVPVACVQLKTGRSMTTGQVKDLFKQRLAVYQHPRDIIFVESFPRTSLGKILKPEVEEFVRDLEQQRDAVA